MTEHLRTAEEARNWFYSEGVSVSDWAKANGYPRQAVYSVLSGRLRCTRGRGHLIAIALGMKRPTTEAGATPSFALEGKQHDRNTVSVDQPRSCPAKAGLLVVTSTKEASP